MHAINTMWADGSRLRLSICGGNATGSHF